MSSYTSCIAHQNFWVELFLWTFAIPTVFFSLIFLWSTLKGRRKSLQKHSVGNRLDLHWHGERRWSGRKRLESSDGSARVFSRSQPNFFGPEGVKHVLSVHYRHYGVVFLRTRMTRHWLTADDSVKSAGLLRTAGTVMSANLSSAPPPPSTV